MVCCRMITSGDTSSSSVAETKNIIDVIMVQDSKSNRDSMSAMYCKLLHCDCEQKTLLFIFSDNLNENCSLQEFLAHITLTLGHRKVVSFSCLIY